MSHLTLALLQLLPGDTRDESLRLGLEACRRAKSLGADLALFPEMWSCGYRLTDDPEKNADMAIPADGPFVRAFGALAKELDMAVGVTFLERWDGLPRNSLRLFDRHGRAVLTYAKVHTCDFDVERLLTRGEDFPTAVLDTAAGPVKVGAMICYDREFPESARILMLRGAELILMPNACPMEINRLSQLRARAFENMLAVATANYPAGYPDCNGHSSVFDGVTWAEGFPYPRETCLLEAPGEEGIYLARLDLDLLRAFRETEIHGNAFRRPEKYGPLTETRIEAPFIRPERRK